MPETKTNKERLKEITDGIEQGIKELFQSDRYRQYLSVMSRFHHYSINNSVLIYGSISEDMVLNGNLVTLRFAPDSEQDNSAEALRSVRETLFRELTETGKLAKSINN